MNTKLKKILTEVLDWLEAFVFATFMVVLLFTFIFRVVDVNGSSMNDTLQNEDRVIIENLFYNPKHEDIVVCNAVGEGTLNETLIKRVIGVSGDEIDIDFQTGVVKRNGEILQEDYIKEPTLSDEGGFEYPITVPEGYVFVMGDNRNHSTDSRSPSVSFVPVEQVLGKVILRIFPIENFGTV